MVADVGLTVGACTLWREKLLFDYTIEVQGERFRVHKVIMASVSEYFKGMLTNSTMEGSQDRVSLHGFGALAVSNMIEFIYTGVFSNDMANLDELLGCAVYFQVPSAVDEVTKLILDRMDVRNCLDMMHTFSTYCLDECVDKVTQFIKKNFDSVIQACVPRFISYDEFLSLIDIWQESEYVLFRSLERWVYDNFQNRIRYLNSLMQKVHFSLMKPQELQDIQRMDIYRDCGGGWRDLVDNAIGYHELPTHLKVCDDSGQNAVRSDPIPVCYTADRTTSNIFYAMTDGKIWKKHQSLQPPDLSCGITEAIVVKNFLVVCVNSGEIRDWYIYDPRTLRWSRMAQMSGPRCNFALVHHDTNLYAFGGRIGKRYVEPAPGQRREVHILTNTIEKYDFESDKWRIMPARMPVALEFHGAGVINSNIHVCGGRMFDSTNFSPRHEAFDISTNKWVSKAPMPKPHDPYNKVRVMEMWDQSVLFVLDHVLYLQFYKPSVDQWSVTNCVDYVDSRLERIWHATTLPFKNNLYLLNYGIKKDPNNQANNSRPCAKWTLSPKDKDIQEEKLDDFPVSQREAAQGMVFIPTLLAIPRQSQPNMN